MAVGHVPWGAAAVGAATELESVGQHAKIALLGRGLDDGHRIWELADSLRVDGREVIVVECGWPRGGADLVSFGASHVVSAALVNLLAPGLADSLAAPDPSVGLRA